jgi:hypothetical protein
MESSSRKRKQILRTRDNEFNPHSEIFLEKSHGEVFSYRAGSMQSVQINRKLQHYFLHVDHLVNGFDSR